MVGMRLRRAAAVALGIGAVIGSSMAQDAREILKQANSATEALKAAKYTARGEGTGALSEMPRYEAEVKVAKGAAAPMMWIDFVEKTPDNGEKSAHMTAGTDGKTVYAADHMNKTFTTGGFADGAGTLIGTGQRLVLSEFVMPGGPFADEVNAAEVKHEGRKDVAGVSCDVVLVNYGEEFGGSRARWYFGAEDHLPRRVERLTTDEEGNEGAWILTLEKLTPAPSMSASEFVVAAPAGYETKAWEKPARPQRPELLAEGETAPLWTLKDPDGKEISLADLRGKLVLMDFWATWCGPCKRAMPDIQALHENYKDKGLVVVGLATWENGDPAKYMKDKGYTYHLALNADDVAKEYRVSGIPTFYLIGKDGTILYRAVGFGPASKQKLQETIDKALQ